MPTLTTSYQLIKTGSSQSFGVVTGYLQIYAKYNSQDKVNNTTSVTYRLNLIVSGGYIGDYNGNKPVKIYGTTGSNTTYIGNGNYYSQQLATYTETITHNNDGTKSGTCSGSVNFTGWEQTLTTGTGNFDLPTIPRASKLIGTITQISNNGTIKITPDITKNVASYYDCLVIQDGTTTITTVDGVENNVEKTLTSAQANAIFATMSNVTNKTFSMYVSTYTDSNKTTLIGSSTSVNWIVNLPSYDIVLSQSVEDTITSYNSYKGSGNENKVYLANISKPKFTFSASSTTDNFYGNTPSFLLNNRAVTSPYTDNNYTGQSYTITATDGRKTATATPTMTHIPYFTPTLNATVMRTTPTGSTIDISIDGSYYDGDGLTNLETATATLVYTESGGSQQTTTISLTTSTSNHKTSFSGTIQLTGMNYQKSIQWSITISDRIGVTKTLANTLTQGLPVWNAYRSGDTNYFNVNGNASVSDNLTVDKDLEVNGIAKNLIVDKIKSKNLIDTNKKLPIGDVILTDLSNGVRATAKNNNQYIWGTIVLDNNLLGKTLTLSSTITASSTNKGAVAIWFTDGSFWPVTGIVTLSQTGSSTFTVPSSFPSGASEICLYVYANLNGTGHTNDYVDYTNLQLEEGSSASTYNPNQSFDVKIKIAKETSNDGAYSCNYINDKFKTSKTTSNDDTYSCTYINNLTDAQDYTITPSYSNYSPTYTFKKIGHLVFLNCNSIYLASISANSWTNIATIPSELKPSTSLTTVVVSANGNSGNISGYGRCELLDTGTIRVKMSAGLSSLVFFTFTLVWVV